MKKRKMKKENKKKKNQTNKGNMFSNDKSSKKGV